MTVKLLAPQRGTLDATTLVESVIPGSPHTLFMQVEQTRDERAGQHPIEYYIPWEFTFADIPACTSAGGIPTSAGATLTLPVLPIYTRIVEMYLETLTAWVSTGGRQDIAGVAVGATILMVDAEVTAAVAMLKLSEFSLAAANSGTNADTVTQNFPIKLAAATAPKIYFEGNDADVYSAGRGILWIKVISYFDK